MERKLGESIEHCPYTGRRVRRIRRVRYDAIQYV